MIDQAQIIESQNLWNEYLTEVSANWKADTPAYIRNRCKLLADDVIDVARGIWKETVITQKTHKLQELYLVDNSIPYAFMVKLDATVAIAAEVGIDIEYDVTYRYVTLKDDNGNETKKLDRVIIEWKVNHIPDMDMVLNWESEGLETTNANVIAQLTEDMEKETAETAPA